MHAQNDHECENGESEGGNGAAVFPLIPTDLQINPLLLAVLHAVVFIDGSTDEIVCPDAAEEAMQYLVTYLQRLQGPQRERLREDMGCLLQFARHQSWPKQQQIFLKSFLADHGLGERE